MLLYFFNVVGVSADASLNLFKVAMLLPVRDRLSESLDFLLVEVSIVVDHVIPECLPSKLALLQGMRCVMQCHGHLMYSMHQNKLDNIMANSYHLGLRRSFIGITMHHWWGLNSLPDTWRHVR